MKIGGRFGQAALLLAGITGVAWRRRCGAVAAGLCLLVAAHAQPQPELGAPRVDPSHGLRGHRMAESWVRVGGVPPTDDPLAGEPMPVTGAFGVAVTLRLSGMTLGSGAAYRPDVDEALDQPGPPVDLTPLLRLATTRALNDAQERLNDAAWRASLRALGEQVRAKQVADIAGRLTVGVQIGHGLETVRIARRAPLTEVYRKFAPGYHGLRIVSADGAGAGLTWPATALAHNTQPQSQVVQPLSDAGYDLEAAAQVGRSGGPPLQRFEVVHVVRPQIHLPVVTLVRGHERTQFQNVTTGALMVMSDHLAQHLSRRMIRGEHVRGTYHPSTGRYDPDLAGIEQTALAAYALAHHCRVVLEAAPNDRQALRWRDEARSVAAALGNAIVRAEQNQPQTVAAAALSLLTLIETPTDASLEALRDDLGTRLLSLQGEDGALTVARAAPDAAWGPAHALALAGLAAWHGQTLRDEAGLAAARGLVARWEAEDGRPSSGELPWLMLAHERLGPWTAQQADDADTKLTEKLMAQRRALGELMDQLAELQIIEPPLLGPADVIGGFEINPTPPGAPPNPDWRTSHMLMFLALAMRDREAVAEREPLGWLLTAGLGARFVDQLIIKPRTAYFVRSLPDAEGGVRTTLWDNRLLPDATAMSLLAFTELRATTRALKERGVGSGE